MKMKLATCLLFFVAASLAPAQTLAQDPGWPRQIVKPQGTLVYYQPQVDDWENFQKLHWRMAFSLTPAGGKEFAGAVTLHGETGVNSETQMVLISNIQVENTYFPSASPSDAANLDGVLRTFAPPSVWITMQRLVACVPKPSTPPAGAQLNNDPPKIIASYKPAILLAVEGNTMFGDVPKTKLQYVINTDWSLFLYDKTTYYLLAGERWLSAPSLDGPWAPAATLPDDMKKLPKEQLWSGLAAYIPPPAPSASAVVPTVLYTSTPAVVLLFDGQPVYTPIQGTQLVYATNTTSYVFVYTPTNQYYYMTGGRWFSASSLAGPWAFASANLPPDFAHIPPTSPAAQVLSSVPGTEEAKDAVMIAQVPTSITVDATAAAAKASVTYDGSPQFVPITGTTLLYATNTAQKVIQVGNLYYLCLQGIWFASASPTGPWLTADSVPQVIYTIPPSSPVYNVTYVTQVAGPSGTVQSSYTAGYMGAFVVGVAVGAVVAGGTGYYYPPYVYRPPYGYPIYHPYPTTYGYSAAYRTNTGAYGVSQTAYGPYGSATRTASYNPYTGTSTRSASVSTPYGKAGAATAYNPYTGAAAATRQGSNGYSSWGSSAAIGKNGDSAYSQHYSTAQGSVGSVRTSAGGKAIAGTNAYGNTATAGKAANGNMYASSDGNVYKNTGSGWQKAGSNGSWTPVRTSNAQDRSSAASSYQKPASGNSMQSMQQDAQNRERGEQSSQRYSQQRSSGGWGGRSSYGGGRRR